MRQWGSSHRCINLLKCTLMRYLPDSIARIEKAKPLKWPASEEPDEETKESAEKLVDQPQ